MADPKTPDRVRDAYLKPIRTVLVVDDDFQSYDAQAQGKDPMRAHALWRACRETGRLCDVDDGDAIVAGKKPNHLFTSDLVILDYHLSGNDPKAALQYLCDLAASDHASIVVVYTNDPDIVKVRRMIAAHLRGVPPKDQWCTGLALDQWDRVETLIKHTPTDVDIERHLAGDSRASRKDAALLLELDSLNVPPQVKGDVAHAYYESLVLSMLDGKPLPLSSIPPELSKATPDMPPWVYARNLFVACVKKTEENQTNGSLVFAALERSLCDWNPDFMLAAVAFARAEFARGGFVAERTALGDQRLKSGWLYHAWSGSPSEQPARLSALFERLIATYSKGVMNGVIEFGGQHVPVCQTPENAAESLKAAIKVFCGDQKDLENPVVHALNRFLVIEELPGHVETGTIFARLSAGAEPAEVYVCVTPACDLVPREPRRDTWERKIHPARAIIAMRAKMVDANRAHLAKAEDNRTIFLDVAGKNKAVLLVEDKPPVPTLEWLFLEDMGRITEKRLHVLEVGQPIQQGSAQGDLAVDPVEQQLLALAFARTEMVAIGQIRAIYASRILQYAGQHLARIGVDFVSYPEDTKTANAKKLGS